MCNVQRLYALPLKLNKMKTTGIRTKMNFAECKQIVKAIGIHIALNMQFESAVKVNKKEFYGFYSQY